MRIGGEASEEAARLVGEHGRRAQQIVVDEIVAALRGGDEGRAAERNGVLRAVERLSSP